MKISEIMKERVPVSVEVFPLKNDRATEPLLAKPNMLMTFSPDFIKCTYGSHLFPRHE